MKLRMNSSVFLLMLIATLALYAGCGTAQSPRRQVEDSTITAQVKTRLASEVNLTSVGNIEVNTTNGVVTLAGQVESDEVKMLAHQIAGSVDGVVSVNNNLQVEAVGIR